MEKDLIFILQDGKPIRVSDLDALPVSPLAPYAVKVMPMGIAIFDDSAYIGINRIGGAIIRLDAQKKSCILSSHIDRGIFGGRTAGQVFALGDRFYCRIYWNSVFETANAPENGIRLVSIAPGENSFRRESLPFSEGLGDNWQLIAILPRDSASWMTAFKKSTPQESDFKYFSCEGLFGNYREVSKREFEAAFRPLPLSMAPDALRIFLEGMSSPGDVSVYEIKSSASPMIGYYFNKTNSTEIQENEISVWHIFQMGNILAGVSESGAGRYTDSGGKISAFRAPSLPDGAVIKDFAFFENLSGVFGIYIWELGMWPDTGLSGFTLFELHPDNP